MPHWGTGGNGVRYVDDILIGFSFPFLYQTSSSNNSKALRTIRKESFMRPRPKMEQLERMCISRNSSLNLMIHIKPACTKDM